MKLGFDSLIADEFEPLPCTPFSTKVEVEEGHFARAEHREGHVLRARVKGHAAGNKMQGCGNENVLKGDLGEGQIKTIDLEDFEDNEHDDGEEDDLLYEANIDKNVEWGGFHERGKASGVVLVEAQRKMLEDQRLKDLKTKNYLFQVIDRAILETILQKDTSKQIWDSLKKKISRLRPMVNHLHGGDQEEVEVGLEEEAEHMVVIINLLTMAVAVTINFRPIKGRSLTSPMLNAITVTSLVIITTNALKMRRRQTLLR
ncbi:hypothetical protein CsSME_00014857 [Camellia sinensis var. sinensis]